MEIASICSKKSKQSQVIKSHIRSKSCGSIVQLAKEICDWAVEIPKYFREGSKGKPPIASPSIWTRFRGSKIQPVKMKKVVRQPISAAQLYDQKAVVDGFRAFEA